MLLMYLHSNPTKYISLIFLLIVGIKYISVGLSRLQVFYISLWVRSYNSSVARLLIVADCQAVNLLVVCLHLGEGGFTLMCLFKGTD